MTIDQMKANHSAKILGPCMYEPAVDCDKDSVCSSCGWNPEVRLKREKELGIVRKRKLNALKTIN